MQTLTLDHIHGFPVLRHPGWLIYALYVTLGIIDGLLFLILVMEVRHWWAERRERA